MRGDKSWVGGIHKTAEMSSIPGLPTQGSDVTILITRVHLHPLCVLVEFWGKFSQDKTREYECLAKDIQSPGNAFQEFEGNPGDQCLVQIDGTWHRSRIVSRNGSKYSVFLIDKGMSSSTTTCKLAWGKREHFCLPPEVEFCVLANVLPLSPESRWSPVAQEFLKSLSGKSMKAHVQDVLVPHRTFVLHIPCLSKQMYEMGLAKKLSSDMFHDFVFLSLQSQSTLQTHSAVQLSAPAVSPQQISIGARERLRKQELFMYPELTAGTVETVIVTEVTTPQRIFCQLKVFSQELRKLSDQLSQCCEGRRTNCLVGPEMIGFPCAARGNDGRWYRSLVQQIFPVNRVVEVLNIDYGTKQFVQEENIKPLTGEFFRLPVVTYICSLHGIIDKGVGWTSSQIDFLRNLLLCKTVIAKFEYQSIAEGVHYVTLYGDENTNINNLFGSKESCLLECERTLESYDIPSRQHSAQLEKGQKTMFTPGKAEVEKERERVEEMLPAEDLFLNSSHVAVVQHVSNPSEFWIQTQNYANELDELMDSIYHWYRDSKNQDVVSNPNVGLYCAAKARDGDFYRATVSEVSGTQIKVFFVDYGNTEVVDRINIRTLPDNFKKLPRLALKCSLTGVRAKDGRWSQSACDFFIKAVTDKELNVHVRAKYDDVYVVQLTDLKAQGERDLSTLMCRSNLAESVETQRQHIAKMSIEPAALHPTQNPDTSLSGVYKNNAMSSQTRNTAGPVNIERKFPTFKEHMFPIGSVLNVSVSYIESPNDFWCQLVQNASHLKLLMHDIQARYAGSEFQPLVETACIARHPDNGMWYRALVIHKHETAHVDVLFVDYGQTETVSLYDLRKICPEFLSLHGQAFRCSLLNPIDPTSAINEWNNEAVAKFHSFVQTAASNFVILKCTIYAVMYSEQKIVFNIVDLETPFESVCTSMISLVQNAPPKKASGSSFRLDTYYYSTHNIKTGTEEQITVTCVNNVNQFYCQLERNTDVMKDLKIKVNNLCHQLQNVKLPAVFGTLCFAKYSDGHWYRGQIKATKPAILVHFVDYGDTIEVDKSDLLPVPKEANDIMSIPVQAVMCGLSDVPANVPNKVNSWFDTSATESKFRALVVAREPDGKLMVELYHRNTQINSKIKKMFQIEMGTEEQVVYQHTTKTIQKPARDVPRQMTGTEGCKQDVKRSSFSAPKPERQRKDETKAASKSLRNVCENSQKVKAAPLPLYRPPNQRETRGQMSSNVENGSEPEGARAKQREENLTHQIESKSSGTESQKENSVEKLPRLADLPLKSITPGMEADVYVSHCNSPLSFYVQLVSEEGKIFTIAEELNDPKSTLQTSAIKDLHPGDLVQAEFADDASWYRAVVREIHGNTMAVVQFIDFGNTAMAPITNLGRLHQSFLQLPVFSIHCMLSDAAALGKEEMLDPETLLAFREDIGGDGEKNLKCQFIRQSGSVWEVSLKDGGMNIICKASTRCLTDGSEIPEKVEQTNKEPTQNSGKLSENPCSISYSEQEFLEEQQLQIYITAVADASSFWCQRADTGELEGIALSVSEVGNSVDNHVDPHTMSPGCPCVALFSEDQLWYRGKVIRRDGDEVSILFVDYGNKSQVNITDVRVMPPSLVATPPQAFLCELQGFDSSFGSWTSDAVDELSALTADKLLKVTVTGVTRDQENIKYLVQMECDGQVINEVMKTWWKSLTPENNPDALGLTTSYEVPLQCDSDVKEVTIPENQLECLGSQEKHTAVACSHPRREHEGTDANSLFDENLKEAMDKSDIAPSSAEDVNTGNMASSFDIMTYSDLPDRDDNDIAVAKDSSLAGTTAVRMVPREVLCPSRSNDLQQTDMICKDLNQTELVLPSIVLPVQEICDYPEEQKTESGDCVSEVQSDDACVENDPVTEEETMVYHEDIHPVLSADTYTATTEPQTCTVPSSESDDVEEVACLTDVCTEDPDEPSDYSKVSSARPDCLISMAAEEMDNVIPEDETLTPHEDKLSALSSDAKAQTSYPDVIALLEEVTCLVGEICLTEACRDQQELAETEDSEQLEQTPAKQKEDCDDTSCSGGRPSSVDDSFEVELSKVTHLSLIISDGCDDVLPVEQHTEE